MPSVASDTSLFPAPAMSGPRGGPAAASAGADAPPFAELLDSQVAPDPEPPRSSRADNKVASGKPGETSKPSDPAPQDTQAAPQPNTAGKGKGETQAADKAARTIGNAADETKDETTTDNTATTASTEGANVPLVPAPATVNTPILTVTPAVTVPAIAAPAAAAPPDTVSAAAVAPAQATPIAAANTAGADVEAAQQVIAQPKPVLRAASAQQPAPANDATAAPATATVGHGSAPARTEQAAAAPPPTGEPAQAQPESGAAPAARSTDANTAVRTAADAIQNFDVLPQGHAGVTPAQSTAAAAAPAAAAPTPAPNASPAVPVAGVAVEIASQALAGKQRFEIRLDPAELGRIDVRIDIDRDGNVSSRLVVERAETLELLRRDAQQLERALQQAGLKTSDNSLQFSLRDQTPQRDQESPQQQRASLIVTEDVVSRDTAQQHYGRRIGSGGGIDIRI